MTLSHWLIYLSVLILGAEAKIKTAETSPVGELTLVDGTDAIGQVSWLVTDPDVSVFTSRDGKQIVLLCPTPRIVRVRQTATDATGKSSDVVLIEFRGGAKPVPVIPPPVVPDAKLPVGRFAISQPALDKAAEVQSTNRKAEATLLAAKLSAVRDRVQSGAIPADDPGNIMDAIRKANGELPKDVQGRWNVWGAWWGQVLFAAWKAEKLKAANDWVGILDETILGLKAVQ